MEEVLYDILIDIHKTHNVLYRDRCLDIFVGYSVGPQTIQHLRWYWYRLIMVANAGGYCGTLLNGYWGITQGGGLSPRSSAYWCTQ